MFIGALSDRLWRFLLSLAYGRKRSKFYLGRLQLASMHAGVDAALISPQLAVSRSSASMGHCLRTEESSSPSSIAVHSAYQTEYVECEKSLGRATPDPIAGRFLHEDPGVLPVVTFFPGGEHPTPFVDA